VTLFQIPGLEGILGPLGFSSLTEDQREARRSYCAHVQSQSLGMQQAQMYAGAQNNLAQQLQQRGISGLGATAAQVHLAGIYGQQCKSCVDPDRLKAEQELNAFYAEVTDELPFPEAGLPEE